MPERAAVAKTRSLPLGCVCRLLPGPVSLESTAWHGRASVMTSALLTMMDFEPPRIGIVMSDRNASFELLRRSRQCVINVPEATLARQGSAAATSPAAAPTGSSASA
jgi:flavin reductase (DIM6/NTAB) family NADH-FMN oxidoreductase RutF